MQRIPYEAKIRAIVDDYLDKALCDAINEGLEGWTDDLNDHCTDAVMNVISMSYSKERSLLNENN